MTAMSAGPFIRVATGYRLTTGLRRMLSLWTALMTAFVVALSLETALPINAWIHNWAVAPPLARVGMALVLVIAVSSIFSQLLRHALRGVAEEQWALLPIDPRRRFEADLAAVAVFNLFPALVLALFVASAAPTAMLALHDATIMLALFAASAVLQTFALDRHSRRDGLAVRFFAITAAIISFSTVEPFIGAVATICLAGGAFDAAASSARLPIETHPIRTGRLESRRSSGLLRHELRMLWLGGGVKLIYAALWGSLITAAAWLAARNNLVSHSSALGRIGALFGSVGAAVIATQIVRARHSMRPRRELEEVLPLRPNVRLGLALASSLPWVIGLPLVTLLLWQGDPARLLVVLAEIVMAFLLQLVAAESEIVSGRSGEPAVIGWGAATAIGGAISPLLTLIGASVATAIYSMIHSERSRVTDFARAEET